MDPDLAALLPALDPLLEKVAQVHGPQDPRLAEALEVFRALRDRLAGPAGGALGPHDELGRLQALTDGFTPPPHACRSYRLALARLEELAGLLGRPARPGAAHPSPTPSP